MSTPTDQQQIRATLRRAGRTRSAEQVALMAMAEAVDIIGLAPVTVAAHELLPPDGGPARGALDLAEGRLRAVESTLRGIGAPTHDEQGARLNANGMLVDWLAGRRVEGWIGPDPMADLPTLLGASEAADLLGMKATNLKRLSPPLPVAAVISGRIPVYRESDVLAAKARRDERRAA